MTQRVTVPEAARRLGRDPETVRRWIRSGQLRALRMGTQYFIELADLPGSEGRLARPAWLRRTATGEVMPVVVELLRRQRAEH